ncbi:MAG: metalloregulator ArsR/SmtB family transcription factor [Chromatiaceae bacterium]|nr:metalloregulator ArsR/SmtB family transcription factor [Chromatiaceae bacterium]
MPLSPEHLTHALSDLTRLRLLMLLLPIGERCVCDLTLALDLPQPKISRHLAVLRETGLLLDRRAGLWIHYRLHPDLPGWARDALAAIGRGCAGLEPFEADRARLDRPTGLGAEILPC